MKLTLKQFMACSILPLAFAACSNDDFTSSSSAGSSPIHLSAGIRTRAADGQWNAKDAIGITMLKAGTTEVANEALNQKYLTATGDGNFAPVTDDATIYFPQDGSEVTFKASYPYNSSLAVDLKIPVSTADQSALPAIDLMTAEHLSGTSKTSPKVELRFYHRLSKLIFLLETEAGADPIALKDCQLTIRGMKNLATYDLLQEKLLVDDTSTKDISVPIAGAAVEQRTAIVLPRAAGAGVFFEFKTPEGRTYTALLKEDFKLEGGYKYTFHITLKKNPVTVSATVEDWLEGPAITGNAISISTPAGASEGVKEGDAMKVYAEDALLTTYIYNREGTWDPETMVYWESLVKDPSKFHASLIAAPALHASQLADILIAAPIEVERNHGVNLRLKHAASQLVIKLASGDQTFSAAELATATVTLPGYLTGGKEEGGRFVAGAAVAAITVDQATHLALFQPQLIKAGDQVAVVTIAGRNYVATAPVDGYNFKAGESHELTLNLQKVKVEVSAKVVPWVKVSSTMDALVVTTPAGASEGVTANDQMKVYLQGANNAYSLLRTFTYKEDGKWYPDAVIYWEEIEADPANFRASILAAAALNKTQMPDLLIATDLAVKRNSGADFELKHAMAKTVVKLTSPDNSFTPAELKAADVVIKFPNYLTGGTELNGQFKAGTIRTEILADRTDPENAIALLQPQKIEKGNPILSITLKGRDYTVSAGDPGFTFTAGENRTILVNLTKVKLTISATVVAWTKDQVALTAVTVGTAVAGGTGDVKDGETLKVFTGDKTTRTPFNDYLYNRAANLWTSSTVKYWEELASPLTFYASIKRAEKRHATQLDDYLVATPVTAVASNGVSFTLKHAAAQVVVELKSTDGSFSEQELAAATAVLPGYYTGATMENGVFVPGTATGDISIHKSTGTPVIASALIQPQKTAVGSEVIRVTAGTQNRVYSAVATKEIQWEGGKTTVLQIDLKKTKMTICTTIVNWEKGAEYSFVPKAFTISGSLNESDEIFMRRSITLYTIIDSKKEGAYTYQYEKKTGENQYQWTTATPLYWDNYDWTSLSMRATFNTESAPNNLKLDNDLKNTNYTLANNQGTDLIYYAQDWCFSDLKTFTEATYVNFTFKHIFSKVIVDLKGGEGFGKDELKGAVITLKNIQMNGAIDLKKKDTPVVASSTVPVSSSIIPLSVTANENAQQTCEALVMPQTIAAGTKVITVTFNQKVYEGSIGTAAFTFEAGKQQVLTVTLNKTSISLSARLESWGTGTSGDVTID